MKALPLISSARSIPEPVQPEEKLWSCMAIDDIKTFVTALPGNIAITCINIYRKIISPLTLPACRYIPTCSEYALTAIQRYGLIKGGRMAITRIIRCHPGHPGGYDPVD